MADALWLAILMALIKSSGFGKSAMDRWKERYFRNFTPQAVGIHIFQKKISMISKRMEHPLVWKQEYLAEFVAWSGDAFFRIEDLLVNGAPIENPKRVDGIFCTIDTATKTGRENDATAPNNSASYWLQWLLMGCLLISVGWFAIVFQDELLKFGPAIALGNPEGF